jgi:hypothetical protein
MVLNMSLTKPQKIAIEQIKELNEWMMNNLKLKKEDCWFIQGSLNRVTMHTLSALVEKKFLKEIYRGGNLGTYYRFTWKEVE